jgi:hypothetical protein
MTERYVVAGSVQVGPLKFANIKDQQEDEELSILVLSYQEGSWELANRIAELLNHALHQENDPVESGLSDEQYIQHMDEGCDRLEESDYPVHDDRGI